MDQAFVQRLQARINGAVNRNVEAAVEQQVQHYERDSRTSVKSIWWYISMGLIALLLLALLFWWKPWGGASDQCCPGGAKGCCAQVQQPPTPPAPTQPTISAAEQAQIAKNGAKAALDEVDAQKQRMREAVEAAGKKP